MCNPQLRHERAETTTGHSWVLDCQRCDWYSSNFYRFKSEVGKPWYISDSLFAAKRESEAPVNVIYGKLSRRLRIVIWLLAGHFGAKLDIKFNNSEIFLQIIGQIWKVGCQ